MPQNGLRLTAAAASKVPMAVALTAAIQTLHLLKIATAEIQLCAMFREAFNQALEGTVTIPDDSIIKQSTLRNKHFRTQSKPSVTGSGFGNSPISSCADGGNCTT